jgi:hypothetical protein
LPTGLSVRYAVSASDPVSNIVLMSIVNFCLGLEVDSLMVVLSSCFPRR